MKSIAVSQLSLTLLRNLSKKKPQNVFVDKQINKLTKNIFKKGQENTASLTEKQHNIVIPHNRNRTTSYNWKNKWVILSHKLTACAPHCSQTRSPRGQPPLLNHSPTDSRYLDYVSRGWRWIAFLLPPENFPPGGRRNSWNSPLPLLKPSGVWQWVRVCESDWQTGQLQ